MLKVGITGQTGFVGTHLYNNIGLYPEEFERVPFKKEFFSNQQQLEQFVLQCDVIIHLAALNRHIDPHVIYQTNLELAQKLVKALDVTQSKAHVLFSSSIQENRGNEYGKSKRLGRQLLFDCTQRNNGKFTGLIIPNVFGPFCQPNYNSVIATFCHKLTHNEKPTIEIDADLMLIYIGDLVEVILSEIRCTISQAEKMLFNTFTAKVSELLTLLEKYKSEYIDNGIIPALGNTFELNLFNTFRSYIDIVNHFPVSFVKKSDERGSFLEIIRLAVGGQVSMSTTFPGVTRGNHFHTHKIERFAVIKGKALIQLRRIGTYEILNFYLECDIPSYIDIPIWYTHNIKNIGEEELYTIFWINEFYDPNNSDTYMEKV